MNCVLNLPRINQLNSRQVYQQIFSEKSLRDIRELQLEQSTKFGGKQHMNRLEVDQIIWYDVTVLASII